MYISKSEEVTHRASTALKNRLLKCVCLNYQFQVLKKIDEYHV